MSGLKVLVFGDVRGHFGAFLKRLESVHKKAGPFDLGLCVGSFFCAAESVAEDLELWNDVKNGKRVLPLPVYILGPNLDGESQFYSDLNGYEIADNLIYLGTHGCLTTKEGLKVAYVSGSLAKGGLTFTYDHLRQMETQLKWNDHDYTGIDILITSDWPLGVDNGVATKPIGIERESTSKLIAKLAQNCKPRYHFAGRLNCHYERQPYRNHIVLKQSSKHVTRFVALGKVGNKEKQKWVYAFNITPIKTIEKSDLLGQPADVTDNPYLNENFDNLGGDMNQGSQFFYDMNAPMEDNNRKRKKRNFDGNFQHKKPSLQKPCWFCLSGEEVEKHLVVAVGDHTYMALPKGGLSPDHILILPIAHHANTVEAPNEVLEEIDKFKNALKKCFKKQDKVVVFFERNYKSFHLQLQAVPLPKECKNNIKSMYQDIADSQSIDMTEIPEHSSLIQMAQPGTPYFYVELPTKEKLYHRVRSGFPLHFGRQVLANPSLLNKEDAIDWRNVNLDKKEESQLAKEFRKMFEPFDFTLEDDE